MPSPQPVTFVVAANQSEILERNFLCSPCIAGESRRQVMVQRGFASTAQAYNDALDRSVNDLVIFVHQDVYLPQAWMGQLEVALAQLETADPCWGVLGCYGITQDGEYRGCLYSSPQGLLGKPFVDPREVQTLDETMLILRRSSGLRFDSGLPHFHLYGTDICLEAAEKGMKSYAVFAPCIHNTRQYLVLPEEFYECCEYIRRRRADWLPVQTTCVRITRVNLEIRRRKLRELYLRYVRKTLIRGERVANIQTLIQGFGQTLRDGRDAG